MDAESKQAIAALKKELATQLKMIKNHEMRIRHVQQQLAKVKNK